MKTEYNRGRIYWRTMLIAAAVLGACGPVEDVTSDDELRRFQYRVVESPFPLDTFATVDVIEDGDGSLVIYSTEIASLDADLERAAVEFVKPNSAGFLRGLKEYLEG